VKGPESSLNEQFNQHYEDAIDTIQKRAIWRVGERVTDLEQFSCRCPSCNYDGAHQRFDIARHRLLFGRPIRQIEASRPMVRCERCGAQRHTRDIGDLVVPTTKRLYLSVCEALPPAGHRTVPLDVALTEALLGLCNEASAPVCRSLLASLAADCGPGDADFIESIGRLLLLPADQVAEVVSSIE